MGVLDAIQLPLHVKPNSVYRLRYPSTRILGNDNPVLLSVGGCLTDPEHEQSLWLQRNFDSGYSNCTIICSSLHFVLLRLKDPLTSVVRQRALIQQTVQTGMG